MEEDHYITTVLLVSTDSGIAPDQKIVGMKQFDPKVDKDPEFKFGHLPHTRIRAVAHCNLCVPSRPSPVSWPVVFAWLVDALLACVCRHGAWESEAQSVVPGF